MPRIKAVRLFEFEMLIVSQQTSVLKRIYIQGMVDGSASKPELRQKLKVEKTYLDIAPYLGAFGAYLISQ